ncbi:MFS general substrate transporter, partial [Aureobasidium melanogenum]
MVDLEKHTDDSPKSASSISSADFTHINEKSLLRKLDWRLLPGVSLLYLVSFLDRSNVANARLDGLTTDLHMTGNEYLTGLTLFFIGYISLEVVWNLILKKIGPRIWLPAVTIVWGIVTTLQGILVNKVGFFVIRTFLGVAEGALFPGVVFYLSMWYKREERTYRVALFFSAASLAGAFGGILAYGIGFMKGIAGLNGWAWIFIIEGIATVLIGVAAYWFIVDWPSKSTFLPPDEKAFVTARLKADSDASNSEEFEWSEVWKAFKDPKVWLYCAHFHTLSLPLYTLSLFLPSIIKSLGYTASSAQLLTIPPYALATVLTVIYAITAEKFCRRNVFIMTSSLTGMIGYIILLANKHPTRHPAASYVGTFFAAAGIYPSTALALSLPAINVSGQTKRATATAMQITIGNLGAILGTQLYRTETAPRYVLGHSFALAYLCLNVCVAVLTWWALNRENKKRDVLEEQGSSISRASFCRLCVLRVPSVLTAATSDHVSPGLDSCQPHSIFSKLYQYLSSHIQSEMSSRETPDMSTKTSTPTSLRDMPPTVPIRRVAPHRRYAKKFLTLPDELLTKISDAVAPEDLPNFRLTCKTLANISAKHFGEKRLAHRRFVFTEYSMRGLIDMTAHPVFGPCVKSIMFGTDYLTNRLGALMDALESHNITDPTEAMRVLQKYREGHAKRSKFWNSHDLHRMFQIALSNLLSLGTSVSLGLYNGVQESPRNEIMLHGYGSSHEPSGLPFTEFITLDDVALRIIRKVCRVANFHPELLEFDLRGQQGGPEMGHRLSRLLLTNGQLQSTFDVCIREGCVDIRVLSSQHRLEFKQRPVSGQPLHQSEDICFHLDLGQPMEQALLSMALTHFRMESCSMWNTDLADELRAMAGTLQVVELIDVAFWGNNSDPKTTVYPVLHCLRDDLRLRTLVLDDVRAMHKDYVEGPGLLVAKGRCWHGQQQIREGLNVLTSFDGHAWDDDDLYDHFEDGVHHKESRLQSIKYSHDDESGMTYEKFLEYKASEEQSLEDYKKEYAEYKVSRARAKEAMARVEGGEFNS